MDISVNECFNFFIKFVFPVKSSKIQIFKNNVGLLNKSLFFSAFGIIIIFPFLENHNYSITTTHATVIAFVRK